MSVTTDWMSHARHGFVVTNIDLLDSRAERFDSDLIMIV